MITRRRFNQGVAAAAGGALMAPAIARAAPIEMRVGLASGVNDAQVAFQTIGMHERLRWYQEDNIEMKIVNTTNTSLPLQLLANAQVEFATTAPYHIIPAYVEHPELNLVSAYTWMPRTHTQTGVKPDSPIKTLQDLKGKTIGIRATGDSGYFFLQGAFVQMGIDPKKDVEWLTVGAGGPAGRALHNGSVDALAIWDVELFRISVAGFPMRMLPNPPIASQIFGNTYLVNREQFSKRKEIYGKMYRSIAKGQIFCALNPRASVLLHWDLYPESKAKGKTDEAQLEDMIKLLEVRRDKWFPHPSAKDQRMGATSAEQWQAAAEFIAGFEPKVRGKTKDLAKAYTLDVLDEANNFDRKKFEEFAKNFKY